MIARTVPHPTVLNTKEILKILPHRYPFLLVDRVIQLDLEKDHIIGLKCLTMNEQFFQGHFPYAPMMPGVLILEALAQVGGILIHEKGYKDKTAVLLNINQAKFRRPAFPGDTLYLHAQSKHFGFRGGRIKAQAFVNDHLVAEAEIGFALRKEEQM